MEYRKLHLSTSTQLLFELSGVCPFSLRFYFRSILHLSSSLSLRLKLGVKHGCSSLSNVIVQKCVQAYSASLIVNACLWNSTDFSFPPVRQTFLCSTCTLTAQRHLTGGANVSFPQHHNSFPNSSCPSKFNTSKHVLFMQTDIIQLSMHQNILH